MSMQWWHQPGGCLCHTSHASVTARAHSLRQEEHWSGRRLRNNTARGTSCATGLLFLLLAEVNNNVTLGSSSVCLLLLSDTVLKGQHMGGLASHQLLRLQSGCSCSCCPGCSMGSFQPKASLGSCCHLPVLAAAPGL